MLVNITNGHCKSRTQMCLIVQCTPDLKICWSGAENSQCLTLRHLEMLSSAIEMHWYYTYCRPLVVEWLLESWWETQRLWLFTDIKSKLSHQATLLLANGTVENNRGKIINLKLLVQDSKGSPTSDRSPWRGTIATMYVVLTVAMNMPL